MTFDIGFTFNESIFFALRVWTSEAEIKRVFCFGPYCVFYFTCVWSLNRRACNVHAPDSVILFQPVHLLTAMYDDPWTCRLIIFIVILSIFITASMSFVTVNNTCHSKSTNNRMECGCE